MPPTSAQVQDKPAPSKHQPTTRTGARSLDERDESRKPSPQALAAFDLFKAYGKRCVVDDVSLHVERGEVVGLLGANGAGKTTTFYMIIGLEQPDSGVVRLGDRELTKLPM